MKNRVLFWYGIVSCVVIFVSLLAFVDVKLSAIISFICVIFVGHTIYSDRVDKEVFVALLFALFVTTVYFYEYAGLNYFIWRINLFPLVMWTAGLVLTREIYLRLKIDNHYLKFSLLVLLYIIMLFALEYIGYYYFSIRLNSNFPSLLGIGILHGPIGMKAFYLLAGPVYIIVTEHFLKKRKGKKSGKKIKRKSKKVAVGKK
jgi:hypothetical protein